jgi:hypothetical protein
MLCIILFVLSRHGMGETEGELMGKPSPLRWQATRHRLARTIGAMITSPITPLTPCRGRPYIGPMATTQLDKLRAALPYSSGAARREIAQQIADAAASAAAEPPPPLRWCAWCGETLAAGTIGDYCNEFCRSEDAAAPR